MSNHVVSVNFAKIKDLAKEKGLTISGLEKQTNLYHNMVHRWKKRGADPKMKALCSVADYLGVKMDDLVERSDK